MSLTDILRLCHLIDLIDVTLACEDPNSKLVEVVTVADVDINIMMLRNMLTTVWCRFGSGSLVKNVIFVQTLSTRFAQDFEVDVQLRF